MSEKGKKYAESAKQWSRKVEVADVAGPIRVGPLRVEDMQKFPPSVWPTAKADLRKNCEKYRNLALDIGAVDAKVISTKDTPLDIRALYVGCINPMCRWLNTNATCPMAMRFPFEEIKQFVLEYSLAVVFKVVPPVMDDVPDVGAIELDMYYTMGGQEAPDKAMLARNIIRLRIIDEMTRRIRAAAYYDGYIMAAPISAGPCLVAKCADIRRCPALEKGGYCRFTMTTQPTGPAVYIDYYKMGRDLGWGELQVGGNCAFIEDVPTPTRYYNIGLVLID